MPPFLPSSYWALSIFYLLSINTLVLTCYGVIRISLFLCCCKWSTTNNLELLMNQSWYPVVFVHLINISSVKTQHFFFLKCFTRVVRVQTIHLCLLQCIFGRCYLRIPTRYIIQTTGPRILGGFAVPTFVLNVSVYARCCNYTSKGRNISFSFYYHFS